MSTTGDSEDRVTMICPNLSCRRTLAAPRSARGKLMRCAYCNAPFRVPKDTPRSGDAVPAGQEDKRK